LGCRDTGFGEAGEDPGFLVCSVTGEGLAGPFPGDQDPPAAVTEMLLPVCFALIRNAGKQPVYDLVATILQTPPNVEHSDQVENLGSLGIPPVVAVIPPDSDFGWDVSQQVANHDVYGILRLNLAFRDPANIAWQRSYSGVLKEESPTPPVLIEANEEDAFRQIGELSGNNPLAVAAGFFSLIDSDDTEERAALIELCSKESKDANYWEDFLRARELLAEKSMGSYVETPVSDVAHVKFLPGFPKTAKLEAGHLGIQVEGVFMTLLHRPDQGGWKVHAIGRPVPPHKIPTART
jgi:hypothetical protein